MKKIVFDCDNTFGVKDCDVDDGLALMYLLGNREAQLLGITSTYGNSSLDVVQAVNLRMLEELAKRLIEGGYQPETPAAIVYKATWEDEKVCRCKVKDLAVTAKENGITKTALIVVGEVLGGEYERSLLYHPEFTTEFRQGKGKEGAGNV